MQAVVTAAFTQRASHVAAPPCSVRCWQPTAGHVAGQLPSDPSSQPDQFKVLLTKGSALTGCVSAVIDRLRVEGELETFAATWVDPVAPPLR